MMVERRGWTVRAVKLWLPLGLFMLFTLFPFYWMAVTSLKPNQELYNRKIMPLIVYHPTLKHYVDLLTELMNPLICNYRIIAPSLAGILPAPTSSS